EGTADEWDQRGDRHDGHEHEKQARQCQGLPEEGLNAELDPCDAGARWDDVQFHDGWSTAGNGRFGAQKLFMRVENVNGSKGTPSAQAVQSVTGWRIRSRNTRSKCAGSCALRMLASRGRCWSHRREIQKRRAPARSIAGSNWRSAPASGRTAP